MSSLELVIVGCGVAIGHVLVMFVAACFRRDPRNDASLELMRERNEIDHDKVRALEHISRSLDGRLRVIVRATNADAEWKEQVESAIEKIRQRVDRITPPHVRELRLCSDAESVTGADVSANEIRKSLEQLIETVQRFLKTTENSQSGIRDSLEAATNSAARLLQMGSDREQCPHCESGFVLTTAKGVRYCSRPKCPFTEPTENGDN